MEVEANNPFDKKQVFTIVIDDEDYEKEYIQEHELIYVDNANGEWEKWNQLEKCEKPFDWNVARAERMELELQKQQRVKILFKFMCFREPVLAKVDDKDIDHANQYVARSIKVSINTLEGFPIQQVQLNITPKLLEYDQTFRYYEQEGSRSVSTIPNFLKHVGVGEVHPLNLCKVKCSNSADIAVDIAGSSTLVASVNNKDSGSMQSAFVFIYQDEFCMTLLGVCKVEIYSLFQINFNVRAGKQYIYD